MIPVLYKADETEYRNNGLGRLSDATDCIVTEERNGMYELEMSYPVTGIHYGELEPERIIFAIPSETARAQPFRIYRITKPLDGIVTVYAQHISYMLKKMTVTPFTASSAAEAMAAIEGHIAGEHPFTFWTDKDTAGNMTQRVPIECRSLLGGIQGSVLDLYGGEFEFDRFEVKLHQNRGNDNGVTIRYGKNLTGLDADTDFGEAYTAIVPYWQGQDESGADTVVIGDKTESEHSADYAYEKCIPMDFSQDFQSAPSKEQLEDRAAAYMKSNSTWDPRVSVDISFQPLWQADEYAGAALIERVGLCDTVTVVYEGLGVSVKAKVIETVYDVLLDRYREIQLGDARSNMSETFVTSADVDTKLQQQSSWLEQAVERATDLITGGLGGYVAIKRNANGKPEEILIMDTEDIATAKSVWRWNKNGFGYSSSGYNGPYRTAITQDGHIVADFIDIGILTATLIKTGILQSKDDGQTFFLDLDNGILRMNVSDLTIKGKDFDTSVEEGVQANMGIVLVLDNEFQGVSAEGDGNIKPDFQADTTATVHYGKKDVTELSEFRAIDSEGVEGNWDPYMRNRYIVTSLTADTGFVELEASYEGFVATKKFTLSKIRDGKPKYTWLKYADDANGKGMSDSPTGKTYMGLAFDKDTPNESEDYRDYQWSLIKGTDGIPGEDGKTLYTWIKYAEDDQGTGMSDLPDGKSYIGIAYNRDTAEESEDPREYTWSRIEGPQGMPGRTYFMETSASIVKRSADNTIVPNYLTLSAYYRDGESTARTAYAGRFKIEESKDGDSWETVYTSAENEESITHSLYGVLSTAEGGAIGSAENKTIGIPRDVIALRCTLYAADETTQILDMQTINVAYDIDALTPMEILDVFSNYGQEDIFKVIDGRIYIQATAIRTGRLILGGKGNGYGQLQIRDSTDTIAGKWDYRGIEITEGNVIDVIGKSNRGVRLSQGSLLFYLDLTEANPKSVGGIACFSGEKNTIRINTVEDGEIALTYNDVFYMMEAGDMSNDVGWNAAVFDDAKDDYHGVMFNVFPVAFGDMIFCDGGVASHHIGDIDDDYGTKITFTNGVIDLYPESGRYVQIHGSVIASGYSPKSKSIETENYGERLLYCYETPTPLYGDAGIGITDDEGICVIDIDDMFMETIVSSIEYMVFLQKEGPGDLWIEEKNEVYFIVKGTPNLKFSWEIKGAQKYLEGDRMEELDLIYGPDQLDIIKEYPDEKQYFEEETEIVKSIGSDLFDEADEILKEMEESYDGDFETA